MSRIRTQSDRWTESEVPTFSYDATDERVCVEKTGSISRPDVLGSIEEHSAG